MASANEPGSVRVVIEDANGNQQVTHTHRNGGAVSAGGSPDGVLANLTADKQLIVPIAGRVASTGDKIRLLMSLDATDGIDASDCVVSVAVTEDNGTETQLTATDFGFTTDLPAATPATSWVELGTGYSVPDSKRIRIGSASNVTPTVISVEDDTA